MIRKIVQSAIISDMFAEEKGAGEHTMTMDDLWRHSLATGLAMEVIGKEDKKKTHFVLGVTHDIGKAVYKRLCIHGGAFNLGLVMRKVTGRGTPRGLHSLQSAFGALANLLKPVFDLACQGHQAFQILARKWVLKTGGRPIRLIACCSLHNIGFATDCYAKRLQKSIEEIVEHKEDFVSQINSLLGGGEGGED